MPSITIYLNDEIYKLLGQKAAKDKTSVPNAATAAIEQALKGGSQQSSTNVRCKDGKGHSFSMRIRGSYDKPEQIMICDKCGKSAE